MYLMKADKLCLLPAIFNPRWVNFLREYGSQVDTQDNDGMTALMVASYNGHPEVVKLLHEYGARIDLEDKNGKTALMWASQGGHSVVVKRLLEYSAQVDAQNNME